MIITYSELLLTCDIYLREEENVKQSDEWGNHTLLWEVYAVVKK